MVTKRTIDRINELAHKAKTPEGLTQEELRERDQLRKEYIAAWKENLVSQLEHTYIQYPDGTKKKLPHKKGTVEKSLLS